MTKKKCSWDYQFQEACTDKDNSTAVVDVKQEKKRRNWLSQDHASESAIKL